MDRLTRQEIVLLQDFADRLFSVKSSDSREAEQPFLDAFLLILSEIFHSRHRNLYRSYDFFNTFNCENILLNQHLTLFLVSEIGTSGETLWDNE